MQNLFKLNLFKNILRKIWKKSITCVFLEEIGIFRVIARSQQWGEGDLLCYSWTTNKPRPNPLENPKRRPRRRHRSEPFGDDLFAFVSASLRAPFFIVVFFIFCLLYGAPRRGRTITPPRDHRTTTTKKKWAINNFFLLEEQLPIFLGERDCCKMWRRSDRSTTPPPPSFWIDQFEIRDCCKMGKVKWSDRSTHPLLGLIGLKMVADQEIEEKLTDLRWV